MTLLSIVAIAALVVLLLLGIGAIVLLKLGVVAQYALKPDRPEDKQGKYSLEESRAPGEPKE